MNNIRYKKFLLILISIISIDSISSYALAKYNIEEIINLYKFLHSNPELSWQEDKTASYLADILEADGYKVTRGVGKKGVVAILENGKGPTLMIRADMDALPVEEKTGLEYASNEVFFITPFLVAIIMKLFSTYSLSVKSLTLT